MFTDLLNLPIDSARARQQDQTLSIAGMTWTDYEKFTTEEYSNYRLSYLNGVITIVSPSQNHEVIERVISILINAYCRQYNLLYFPMGSTTLKNPPLAGKEPDTSYSFDIQKNTPDLAVEVIYSSGETPRRRKTQGNAHQESGSIDDSLMRYKYLNVREVWFWQNNEMKFYQLTNSEYREIVESVWLNKITPDFLAQYVNRGLTESPLTIEADFISGLN